MPSKLHFGGSSPSSQLIKGNFGNPKSVIWWCDDNLDKRAILGSIQWKILTEQCQKQNPAHAIRDLLFSKVGENIMEEVGYELDIEGLDRVKT